MNNKRTHFRTFMQVLKLFVKIFIMFCKTVTLALSKFYKWLVKRLYFSITFKITTVYAVIFTLIMFLFNAGICTAFIAYLGTNSQEKLMKDFQVVSSYLSNSSELPTANIDHLSGIDNVEITIFNPKKQVLYTTLKNETLPVFFDKEKSKDNNFFNFNRNYYFIFNNRQLYYNGDTEVESGLALILNDKMTWQEKPIYIQITDHLKKEVITVVILLVVLFSLTFIVIVIVILVGSRASKRMLSPVDKMTKTAKSITISALDTRLDVGGSQDELKDLAETFNSMLDRIQLSYEQQNQFVSDASHELRTPISVIQGYANLLDRWGKDDPAVLQESIESIKTEAANMKDLIEKLLFLARGDKKTQKIERETFLLNELLDEIIRETKLIDTTHQIDSYSCENLFIHADRKLIKEALRIFIDNSIKYTPQEGRITINCIAHKSQAVITIEDTGIGIPKEDLPYIFNRFYRADKSRTKQTGGTGLGLAIAKWIIQKHQGKIEVDSKINEGTKISVFLPVVKNKGE